MQPPSPAPRKPYGRRAESRDAGLAPTAPPGGLPAPYQGATYYGLPAVKPSPFGTLISTYFFVGGLAGSALVLASVADLVGGKRQRGVVRAGRSLALAGSLVSPVLLIADLHAPKRWYNMLRIVRPTSPMSIGSWTLAAFGTLSGLAVVVQRWEDRAGSRRARRLGKLLSLLGIPAGAMMSVYTGTLLSATSTPLWAAVPRLLPALFGASAASTAAAAINLTLQASGADDAERRGVEAFGVVAETVELALVKATHDAWRAEGLDAPLREPPLGAALVGAVGLGVVLPLALHGVQALTGRRSRVLSAVASVSTLAGGLLLRTAVLFAGNRSARRPEDYFHFTSPQAPVAEGPEPTS